MCNDQTQTNPQECYRSFGFDYNDNLKITRINKLMFEVSSTTELEVASLFPYDLQLYNL